MDNIRYPCKIVNYIIGTVGTILNATTLIVLVSRKDPLKVRLKLLLSLCLSDLLIACLSTIYYDVCFYNVWIRFFICDGHEIDGGLTTRCVKFILGDIYTLAQYAGLGTMFAISVDLLYSVRNPLKYSQWNTSRRGFILVFFLWIIPFVVQLVFSIMTKYTRAKEEDLLLEFVVWSYTKAEELFFVISTLSLLAFVIIYVIIFCSIRQKFVTSPSSKIRSLRKAAITMFMIVATYALCMVPLLWIFISQFIFPDYDNQLLLSHVFRLVYMCNTVFDPIIYSIRIPEVRSAFLKAWHNVIVNTSKCFRSSGNHLRTNQEVQRNHVARL